MAITSITATPSPADGSNIGQTWSCLCTCTASVGPAYFENSGGGFGPGNSACTIQLAVNGGTLNLIYDGDNGGFVAGYTGTDTVTNANGSPTATGTVSFSPTVAWPNGTTLRIVLGLQAHDRGSGGRTGYTTPSSHFLYTVVSHLVTTTTSSAENTALAGDLPFLMGNNVIESYSALPVWTAGIHTWASYTDVTDPLLPTRYIFDRHAVAQSGPVYAAGQSFYTLLMSVTYSPLTNGLHSFDTFAVLNHNLSSCGSGNVISLQLSDSNDFSSGATPINVVPVTSDARIVITNLNTTHARYTGVTFARLIVTCGSGTFSAAPLIGELIMGRRRQLSYFPDVPFEDKGSESDVTDHRARSGTISRYVRSKGARRLDWTFRSAGADRNGLNQENEVRSWWRECNFGTQPSLVVQRPTSSPMPLYMLPEKASLEMPIHGPYERSFPMPMVEQPTYWQTEQAALNLYPV